MKTLCVTGHRPAKLPWKYKKKGSNTMSIASPSVVILMIVFATATHILFRVWRSVLIWTLLKPYLISKRNMAFLSY